MINEDKIWFKKDDKKWIVIKKPSRAEKGPQRYGTFKDAFNHNMIFVLGTQGNNDEDKWAREKARYDAETFWYQGNGSIDIILDTEFIPEAFPDRNVILYGNEKTNKAWYMLLKDCPVKVTKKMIKIGTWESNGNDLGIIFTYPRRDSDLASIGVVAGTGKSGARN